MNAKNINQTLLEQFNKKLEILVHTQNIYDPNRELSAIEVFESTKKLFEHQEKINKALYDMILMLPGRSQEKRDKIAELDQ